MFISLQVLLSLVRKYWREYHFFKNYLPIHLPPPFLLGRIDGNLSITRGTVQRGNHISKEVIHKNTRR